MSAGSIKWNLLGWFGALLALVLVAFNLSAWSLVRDQRLKGIDAQLQELVAAMAADLRASWGGPGGGPNPQIGGSLKAPPGERRKGEAPGAFPEDRGKLDPGAGGPPSFRNERRMPGPTEVRRLTLSSETWQKFAAIEAQGGYYYAWSRFGVELQRSARAPEIEHPDLPNYNTQTVTRTRAGQRESVHVTELGDVVLVGESLAKLDAELFRVGMEVAGASLAFLLLALGGSWVFINRSLRPIGEISRTAAHIAAGNLTERIPEAKRQNELTELAAVLNATFSRLDAAFGELRQFTADASHELRTPLAVMISEAQSALTRSRSEAEYREALATCLEAAQEMRRLADALLALARLESGREALQTRLVALRDLAEAGADRLAPLAAQKDIALVSRIDPAPVLGDATRLKQVLLNLLDNAIHYTPEGGRVEVRTFSEEGFSMLEVSDSGIGIAPEHQAAIFKRFYRVDAARTSGSGRSGLGLAIVKAIVDAHGGSIRVESAPGRGSVFVLRFPAGS